MVLTAGAINSGLSVAIPIILYAGLRHLITPFYSKNRVITAFFVSNFINYFVVWCCILMKSVI